MDILVGIGLGELNFGMSRDEVKKILGPPDYQEINNYDDGEDSIKSDAWEYHPLRLDLSFQEDEDWKLTIISIASEDYLLKGSSLIGLEIDELMEELEILGFRDLEIEDVSSEDSPEHKLVSSEELGINFWLQKGVLEEIQWGPQFIDDENIKWPK